MGNLGLATFSEDSILYNDLKSSLIYKQKIAYEIGHQIASMWFGGFSTAASWRNNFLNVGFASYFGLYALNQVLAVQTRYYYYY